MSDVYIYDAIRTPRTRGRADGALYEVKPIELGACLLRELEARYDLDTSRVEDVLLGCTAPAGEQGGNIGKAVALQAGWSETVPGAQIDRYCASSLDAVNIAAQGIASGWAQLVVAGGVESMSRVPMGSAGGALLADPAFVMDHRSVPMGIAADLLATTGRWNREAVDAYSLESQRRAAKAQDDGRFDRSVVPVRDRNGLTIAKRDDSIKRESSLEKLAVLKPSFAALGDLGVDEHLLQKYPALARIDHVHTAGNSSAIVDGASAVLLGSEQAGKELGLKPRGRILMGALVATDPSIIFCGPAPACRKALALAKLTPNDIDLWELNEAFAAVVLEFMREMDIGHDVINVNGGAIALGHPLGATGAMLISTVLDELERQEKRRAMVTLCAAGGIGIATIVERA